MEKQKPCDLAIIGGGPAALNVLSALSERSDTVNLPQRIVIFEAKPEKEEMGRGVFAKKGAIESHLMLNPGDRMSRIARGEALNREFDQKVAALQRLGVEVTTLSGANVTSCKTDGQHHHITYTHNNSSHELDSSMTVLATGYYQEKTDYKARPDYIRAYPAVDMMERISQKAQNGRTVALGTGPTGVDVAIAWAEKVGNFVPHKDGSYTFQFKPGYENARLTLASPSGRLPTVMEKESTAGIKGSKVHFNSSSVERLRNARGNEGYVPVGEMMKLIIQDLQKINPSHYLYKQLKNVRSLNDLIQVLTPDDAAFAFSKDMEMAKSKGFFYNSGSAWQAELALNPDLSAASQYFSAEDMQHFQKFRSILTAYSAPIPLENAEKLQALFAASPKKDDPYFSVVKLKSKEPPKPARAGNGFTVKTTRGELQADLLVDGVPGKDIRRHPSPLVQQMLKDGLIQPGFATFQDPAQEREAAASGNPQYAKAGKPGVNEKTVLLTDGIMINPQSREVVPAISNDRDYKSTEGPTLMTMGNLAANRLLTSMGMLKDDATRIALEVSKKVSDRRQAATAGREVQFAKDPKEQKREQGDNRPSFH
jgi:hypothetical protein